MKIARSSGTPRMSCLKCGKTYHGWALTEPEHQTCPKCGAKLEDSEEGGRK